MSLLKLMQCLAVSPPPVALRFAHLYLSVGIPTTERKVGPAEYWWMGHAKNTGSRRAGSVIVAHGPSRSAACGILPDQGSNPRVSCDACLKGNFRGRRYKCLICYDYDLCASCYESGATTTRHTTDHPMQCILTRVDFDLYYGGEAFSVEQPQSFTCPYCGKMGYTETSLQEHVTSEHAETSTEVIKEINEFIKFVIQKPSQEMLIAKAVTSSLKVFAVEKKHGVPESEFKGSFKWSKKVSPFPCRLLSSAALLSHSAVSWQFVRSVRHCLEAILIMSRMTLQLILHLNTEPLEI
ncbi:hypothetical protein J1605_012679 [Eschrichtius robustus]|uniref:E3 ubiquitin-protein ligase KCMF1 n=1 Tax=Eschrichtius robustus TaxID=9764 RepID=A0AB34GKU6_ESCRO|nr:hypothetical protein J1605_012679 [Eschrichtius robustus]